jgi:NADPH:quinone reductase-like Zn-dependent oxidoreductase
VTEFTRSLRSGELYAATETVLPLTEAVQAHRLMEDRKVLGRVVLVP